MIGVATAYWLARLGARPLLLESRRLAWGASGRNAGFMLAGSSPLEDPRLIREVLGEEAIDAGYDEPGHLALASSPAVLEKFREEAAGRPAAAAPLHALDRGACEELLGMRIDDRFAGGRWLPAAAAIDPARFVYGLAAAAVRRGATLTVETPALRLESERSGGVEIATARGPVRAGRALVACSAGSRHLLPLDGVITPVRGQMLSTAPLERVFQIGLAVDWGTAYWRQAPDGVIVLGGCRSADPDAEVTAREALNPRVQVALTAFLPAAFPDFPPFEVARRWAGIMDETPDGRPIAGRWPDGSDRWVAAGFGGHGLPLALGVGRSLAAAILDGRDPDELERLRPERFLELAAAAGVGEAVR